MALQVDFTGQSSVQSGSTSPTGHVHDKGTAPRWSGNGGGPWYILKSRVDTSKTGGTNTSTDVYQAIAIPAETFVLCAWIKTVTAETSAATATISLGDGDGTAGYLTAVVPSTTVGGIKAELYGGTAAYHALAGRYYMSADTIDILVGTAAFTDGVYDVYALCCDLTGDESAT